MLGTIRGQSKLWGEFWCGVNFTFYILYKYPSFKHSQGELENAESARCRC